MQINFRKMHGNGNDFMVVHADSTTPVPDAATIRNWADRRRGVGFDQLLWTTPPAASDFDAEYRIFNADGSEVEQCGNGVRCIARDIAGRRRDDSPLMLKSPAGTVTARLNPDGSVSVDMGEPDFEPANVPFLPVDGGEPEFSVQTPIGPVELTAVSIGNPHAVVRVENVDTAPVEELGAALQAHRQFPQRVNVSFLEIAGRRNARLRVYERGVGETQACGTAACAAMAAGWRLGYFDDDVALALPGGDLMVSWRGPDSCLWLTGPAITAYEGKLTV